MNLLLHQVLKDLRQLRVLLFAWLAVLVVRSLLLAWPVTIRIQESTGGLEPGRQPPALIGDVYAVLTMALIALTVVIAVLLVQADSPATTTAFWLTRPISQGTMLAAKLAVACLVLAVVPVLADVAILGAFGIPPGDMAAAAGEGWLEFLAIVAPVAMLAALTLDLGGFALGALGLLAGAAASLALVFSIGDRASATRTGQPALLAASMLSIGSAGVVTAVQYLGRARRRSVVLVGVGLVAFALVARFWTFGLASPSRPAGAVEGEGIPAVAGNRASADGVGVDVMAAACSGGRCTLVVREARAQFAFDRRPIQRVEYRLLDPRADVPLVSPRTSWVDELGHAPAGNHLAITFRLLAFEGSPSRPLDAESLSACSLVPTVRRVTR